LSLRHQLNVLRRTFTRIDRLVFAGLYRLAPGVLDALTIVRPETVIGWHRSGFRAYWHWKSRPRSGRPKTRLEIRQLIRKISLANQLWGAPRIHGELLKLGELEGIVRSARHLRRALRPSDRQRRAPSGRSARISSRAASALSAAKQASFNTSACDSSIT
jgi:hypothetical protein